MYMYHGFVKLSIHMIEKEKYVMFLHMSKHIRSKLPYITVEDVYFKIPFRL